MNKKLNFLIIEDSLIFIEGLIALLHGKSFTHNVLNAQNIKEAFKILEKETIDFVILDLNFETKEFNGFTIAKKIRKLFPEIKVLVLSEHVKVFIYYKLFDEYDVHAYLDKQLGFEQLSKAIEEILKGNKYIDSNIEEMIKVGERMKMSKREKEVVPYLLEGYTQKEIGDKLFISKKTVEKHIDNMASKFGVKRTVPVVVNYLRYIFSHRENSEGGISPLE